MNIGPPVGSRILLLGLGLGHELLLGAPSTRDSRSHAHRATLVAMTPRRSHASRDPGPAAPPARPVAGRHAAGRSRSRGALFVVSAANSEGTDLRPGRYTDLASLVADEADDVRRARRTGSRDLKDEVDELTAAVERPRRCKRYQRRIEALQGPGRPRAAQRPRRHRHPVRRPGGRHQLRPATSTCCVVHQQDIQAVVNALWKGGADRGHDPGPAGHLHHRHQVRGQRRPAAGRALPPALRHPGGRRPDRAAGRARRRRLRRGLPRRRRQPRASRSAGTCDAEDAQSPRRRTTACSTSATPSAAADRAERTPAASRPGGHRARWASVGIGGSSVGVSSVAASRSAPRRSRRRS